MTSFRKLLAKKGRFVLSISPEASVYDAIAKMAEHSVGALVVIDDEGMICGMISERDYARRVILKNRSSRDTPVHAIMTRDIVYGSESYTVEDGLAVMTAKRIRHLPILDGEGDLVGLISMGDLVKERIAEQAFMIEQLEQYITGSYTAIPGRVSGH